MRNVYMDFEFNGLGGHILSLGLVDEEGNGRYYVFKNEADEGKEIQPWVAENVVPKLMDFYRTVDGYNILTYEGSTGDVQLDLVDFLKPMIEEHGAVNLVSDWPDDIKYMSQLMITGPGTMIDLPGIHFEVARVDAYPNMFIKLVQHNAISDALALRWKLTGIVP